MKKVILFLLTISMLSLNICGCNGNGTKDDFYKVYEVELYDTSDGGKHNRDLAAWSDDRIRSHQDPTALEQATVTFNGMTFTGTYERTNTAVPNLYKSHRYVGLGVKFDIHADTGELTNISFLRGSADEATVDETYCRKVADSIADDYVELDDYKVKVDIAPINKANYSYVYFYYREIGGFMTGDYFTIAVDGNGNLRSFGVTMLGSFADVKSVSVNKTRAKKAVKAKLDTIYTDDVTLEEYELDDGMIIKLEDGSCAVLYTVNVHTNQGYGQLQLAVTVDHRKR